MRQNREQYFSVSLPDVGKVWWNQPISSYPVHSPPFDPLVSHFGPLSRSSGQGRKSSLEPATCCSGRAGHADSTEPILRGSKGFNPFARFALRCRLDEEFLVVCCGFGPVFLLRVLCGKPPIWGSSLVCFLLRGSVLSCFGELFLMSTQSHAGSSTSGWSVRGQGALSTVLECARTLLDFDVDFWGGISGEQSARLGGRALGGPSADAALASPAAIGVPPAVRAPAIGREPAPALPAARPKCVPGFSFFSSRGQGSGWGMARVRGVSAPGKPNGMRPAWRSRQLQAQSLQPEL